MIWLSSLSYKTYRVSKLSRHKIYGSEVVLFWCKSRVGRILIVPHCILWEIKKVAIVIIDFPSAPVRCWDVDSSAVFQAAADVPTGLMSIVCEIGSSEGWEYDGCAWGTREWDSQKGRGRDKQSQSYSSMTTPTHCTVALLRRQHDFSTNENVYFVVICFNEVESRF
jgi:hypothetical protein